MVRWTFYGPVCVGAPRRAQCSRRSLGAQRGPNNFNSSTAAGRSAQPKKNPDHTTSDPSVSIRMPFPKEGHPNGVLQRRGRWGVFRGGAPETGDAAVAWGLPPTLDIPPSPCSERRLLQTFGKVCKFVASLRACPQGAPGHRGAAAAWGLPPTLGCVGAAAHARLHRTTRLKKQKINKHKTGKSTKTKTGKQQTTKTGKQQKTKTGKQQTRKLENNRNYKT
jgi:hypothetical protein